jgi:hypothetical protein
MNPSTEWKETIAVDENERFDVLAEILRGFQKRFAHGGATSRALHAKQHIGAHAELVVASDLPPELRAGLFALPGTYRAYVRYSNGAGRRQGDHKPDVRGIAVKVVGVPGKKVIPGLENARTQDFLAIQSPATPFEGPDEFVAFVQAGVEPWRLPAVMARFGFFHTIGVLKQFLAGVSAPVPSLATLTFHSALPVAWGPYAAKYRFVAECGDALAPATRDPERLATELAERLRKGPVAYAMQAQLFRSEALTPIEDGSRVWSDFDAPPLTVARLVVAQQDVTSESGRALAERVAQMSFDPWHALAAHRPLGAMMRARNNAYRMSTKERHASAEPEE